MTALVLLYAWLVFAVPVLPAYVLLAPPVVMASARRRSRAASALWALGLLALAVWATLARADFRAADELGGAGNLFAGAPWLMLAVLLASMSLVRLHCTSAAASAGAGGR